MWTNFYIFWNKPRPPTPIPEPQTTHELHIRITVQEKKTLAASESLLDIRIAHLYINISPEEKTKIACDHNYDFPHKNEGFLLQKKRTDV